MTRANRPGAWTLQAPELHPYRLVNERGRAPFVLVCDHASPRIPLALDDLGLEPHLLGLHIAYDLGAEALTRELARRFDAAAVLGSYSRLVVDLNRGLRFADAMPEMSDGHVIPGNLELAEAERRHRARLLFHPYHGAVARTLAARSAPGLPPPGVISVHSFTPHMNGRDRPWHVSVMWRNDGRIAVPLIGALRAHGLTVGDNEPYSAFDPAGYTVRAHAENHGAPSVLIEVRQDLLTDEAGIHEWYRLLGDTLEPILYGPELYAAERERDVA